MSRTVKQPYCKVCQDAGKPESEYTSHWVKDLTGKTTCPTLLNTECRYCYKTGHTTKFCGVLMKYNKDQERARTKPAVVAKPAVKPVAKKQTNHFASLCDDSDSDEEREEEVSISIEYPALTIKKLDVELPKVKLEVKTGWASIAAKPKEAAKPLADIPRQRGLIVLSDFIKEQPPVQQKMAPWAKNQSRTVRSWADCSDSEEDELPEVNFSQVIIDDTW